MEPVTEQLDSLPAPVEPAAADEPSAGAIRPLPGRPRSGARRSWGPLAVAAQQARFAIVVYLATRALLLAVVLVQAAIRHHSSLTELANWDGMWYRELANKGYPAHPSHLQTTLGFFPLYPVVMWLVAHAFLFWMMHSPIQAITAAGVIVSLAGGLVAAILVQVLATGWWGSATGRRAVALFCLFPGSVVLSMVYAEGLVIPLAAACILALQRRRWLLAGLLAGFATATEPEALVLAVVCAVTALGELRRRGLADPAARRSLLAPLLSLTGVGAVAAFLWVWTGTPFATLIAQRDGWSESTDPLALVRLAGRFIGQVSFAHFDHPTINLNLPVGLAGAIVLVVLVVLLLRVRREVSIEALAWTLGIALLGVTSEYTPPTPRLLITAFPAVLVLARYLKGRAFSALLLANGILLVGLSLLTFVGTTLRP